jgi:hypothetical protein
MRRHPLVIGVLFPAALAAQAPAAAPLSTDSMPDGVVLSFARFADIFGGRLVAALEAVPAARYGYRPTPAQQTVGYIAQHVEDANYALCARFADVERPAPTAKDSLADSVKARWPKDTLVARLRASMRFCDAALDRVRRVDSPALANSLLAFETDLAEHYSQVAAYMRLLGLVPPSAAAPKRRTAVALPASQLAPYAGVYQLAPGYEVQVTLRGEALFAQSNDGGAPARLWAESPSDFFLKEADAQVTFTRDARGVVTGLVLHQFGRDRPARKIR